MAFFQHILRAAILILLTSVVKSQMYEGDRCIHASQKQSGVCTLTSNCPTALSDSKLGKYPQICGFKGNKPVICCIRNKRKIGNNIHPKQKSLNFDANGRIYSFTTHKNGIDFQQDWQSYPRLNFSSSSKVKSTRRPAEDKFFDNVPNFETSFSNSGRPNSQNGFGNDARPNSQNEFVTTTRPTFVSNPGANENPASSGAFFSNGRPISQNGLNNNVRPNSQSGLNSNVRPNSQNTFQNTGGNSRPSFDTGFTNNNGRPNSQNGLNNDARPSIGNTGRPVVSDVFGNGNTNGNNDRRPSVGGADDVSYPKDEDLGPDVISGPDDTRLSNSQRKRAASVADMMCRKYSSSVVDHVEGIPLLLDPEPIRVEVPRCTLDSAPLVVGGELARTAEFPHTVALGWPLVERRGYAWSCGGSLVSESFVLTAAHCTYQDRDVSILSGAPRVVHVGDNHLGARNAQIIAIEKAIKHPQYKPPKVYNDIALLKLKRPVRLSEDARPACLGWTPNPGEAVIAAGWGRTEDRGRQSEDLRAVQLSVTEGEQCSRSLGTSRRLPTGPAPTQVCAGDDRGGRDTCQGDSGGPLQTRSTDNRCIAHIVGITSLGRSCGEKHTPALYTRVSSYIPFIVQVVWPDRI